MAHLGQGMAVTTALEPMVMAADGPPAPQPGVISSSALEPPALAPGASRAAPQGEYPWLLVGTLGGTALLFLAPEPFVMGWAFLLWVPLAWTALRHSWRRTWVLFSLVLVVGLGAILLNPLQAMAPGRLLIPLGVMALAWACSLGILARIQKNLSQAAHTEAARHQQRAAQEEALLLSERKFRTLFENMAEGMALHDLVTAEDGTVLNYRILDANPSYQRHTGIAPEDAKGRLGNDVYGTETPPYLEEFSSTAIDGKARVLETYFPPLDKHFHISIISPLPGQFATVFEDISDRKHREEELKRKNTEMERFTYMVSHDLKSPLVTVRTFLGYLEQDLAQNRMERVHKDMEHIRAAAGKMSRLLEDLLEVSRVGRLANPPVRVSLEELYQEAVKAVAGAISAQQVTVHLKASQMVLYGDRPRLEEIWQNLLENAVKYMGPQPHPRVEMGAEGTGVDTVFYVQDNGIGIEARYVERIFGLFEKLDTSTEGTGLGLALVKRIVELHAGRIWVESEGPGRGSCFKFTLPLAIKKPKGVEP